MSSWDGLLYAVGYYQGKSSTYDRRRPRVREKPTLSKRIAKGILWVLLWGFFLFAI